MSKKPPLLERWETPIVNWFFPGISLRHRDDGNVEVYVHTDKGPAYRFYWEPLAFRVTSEPASGGLPRLSSPACTAICRNSEWISNIEQSAAALSARKAAKKCVHYVIFGGSWTFEALSAVEAVIEERDKLPESLCED